ncbi:MAG: helix-turn-helix transcriptional regulator [Gammaproteobacteria bacterium]
MKQSHTLAYLRQICCSGLSWETAMIEFNRTVSNLISSHNNGITVCREGFQLAYLLAEYDLTDIASIAPEIISDFLTLERRQRAAAWFARYSAIRDARVMEATFYKTDMYNLINKRFDMYHVLWAPMELDAKYTAVAALYRTRHQKPFDDKDQARLMHLRPYIVHAYQAANDIDFEPGPSAESGMLIMDTRGNLLYQSPEAKRILHQARYPRLLIESRREDRLLTKLAALCRSLQNIFLGRDAPPPSFTHSGPNGRFTFRAYWLDGCQSRPDGVVGIIVEHRQPLILKILRGMRESPLSPTQKEVTLLLAQGLTLEQICGRLHVKPTTLKDHIRKIYLKLDIHQREELLPKLLGMESNGGARRPRAIFTKKRRRTLTEIAAS